ncbi:MAG: penicillin-binding protein [Candidatus Hydrogenedentota bacterium]|mgnify:CR=1 FL=1
MKGRVYILLLATLAGFTAVIVKLASVQIVEHSRYVDLADRNVRQASALERQRGTIYDRRGRELALSVRMKSLAANPGKFLTDEARDNAVEKLAPLLAMPASLIRARLQRPGEFAWIARKLPEEKAAAIAALKIPGLFFETEFKRFYPHDSVAAHVLGFVGIENEGLEGMERAMDAELRGPEPEGQFVNDAYGNPVPVHGEIRYPDFNGHSVHLTIDLAIQTSLEQALARQVETFGAKSASGVVMDPVTGEILALANWPTYDLNDIVSSDGEDRRNRAVTDAFEPGSTFKVFTGSIALDTGAVTSTDMFYCPGHMKVSGHTIKCHHPHGQIDYRKAIEVSCNVAAMTVAQKIDAHELYDGLRGFGFGQKTGIELIGEASGILRPVSQWSGLSNSMLSLGQELAVTTMQLATATAALANGGRRMTPRLIARITDASGRSIKSFPPDVKAQPVNVRSVRQMTSIMEGVVSRGTGILAAVPPFPVSGKTGTAQISGSQGGYIEGRYNAVFIGWTPSEAPVLAMAIVVHDPDPSKGYYGGAVAAPVFGRVGTEAMQYLGIRPAWGRDTGASGRPVVAALPSRRSGAVRGGKVVIPDLRGMTLREANELMSSLPLVFQPSGSGIASTQSIPPETLAPIDSVLRAEFIRPDAAEILADM